MHRDVHCSNFVRHFVGCTDQLIVASKVPWLILVWSWCTWRLINVLISRMTRLTEVSRRQVQRFIEVFILFWTSKSWEWWSWLGGYYELTHFILCTHSHRVELREREFVAIDHTGPTMRSACSCSAFGQCKLGIS